MKKLILMILVVIGMLSNITIGMTPVGAPSTSLKKGEIELAYDYTESTIQNIEMDFGIGGLFLLENVKSQLSTYTLTCNVASDLSYFLRFGSVDMQAEENFNYEGLNVEDQWELDTNLFSIGAKANLFTAHKKESNEKLIIGFTLQGTYMNLQGRMTETISSYWYDSYQYSTPVAIEIFEGKFAFGPTYTNGKLAVYGCPVIYYLHGKGNFSEFDVPFTIDGITVLGCLGGSFQITDDLTIRGEYQFGGNNYETVSCGLAYKF